MDFASWFLNQELHVAPRELGEGKALHSWQHSAADAIRVCQAR